MPLMKRSLLWDTRAERQQPPVLQSQDADSRVSQTRLLIANQAREGRQSGSIYGLPRNYGLLRGTFTQRCRPSEKRMAKIVIVVIRVKAISFPDIQTPLGIWLSGQAETLTEGEEKPGLPIRG